MANFKNRADAGQQLADSILARHPDYRNNPKVIVLGLARGGVTVAAQVAKALNARLDAIVVRKLGMPSHEEYAFGALAPQNTSFINRGLVSRVGLSPRQVQEVIDRQQEVLTAREGAYRKDRPPIELANLIAIIVDDGIATGATMQVAVMFARKLNAAKVIAAVPVSPADSQTEFEPIADEFICPNQETVFSSVGQFYEDFGQVDDAAVIAALRRN